MTVDDSATRGRRTIAAFVGVSSVLFAALTLRTWRVNPHFPAALYLATGVVLLTLGALTYRRYRWARAALACWVGLIVAFTVVTALGGFYYSPLAALVLLGVAGAWGIAAVGFYRSPHISAYLTAPVGGGRESNG